MPQIRELTQEDAPALTALYGDYEWWADRAVEDVRQALLATEVALGIEAESAPGRATQASTGDEAGDDDRLLAAARVLTDFTYYATVFDVIVAADRRGEGLGRQLLTAVLDHPDLQELPGLSLLCRRGLVPYYESVGFELHDEPVDVPEGGTGELVRMRYVREE